MKNYIYLLTIILLTACGGSGTNNVYEKTITGYLLKGKDTKENTGFKIIELSEQGTIRVADSIAYLTDEFRKDKQLIIDRIGLAKKMREDLQAKTKLKSEFDKYNADISVMDNRIDSLKNLAPDNLQGYDNRNANDILAKIIRCKYSVTLGGKTAEETFDFYLSPDGSRCYAKTRAK